MNPARPIRTSTSRTKNCGRPATASISSPATRTGTSASTRSGSCFFDLGTFADTGVKQLEGGFYAYNQARAKEELAYRRALRKEIEDFGGNLPAFDAVIRDR